MRPENTKDSFGLDLCNTFLIVGNIQQKKQSKCHSFCLQSNINFKKLSPLNSYWQCLGSDLHYFLLDNCNTFKWFSCSSFFSLQFIRDGSPLIIRSIINSFSQHTRCFNLLATKLFCSVLLFSLHELYSSHTELHKSPESSIACF